MILTVNVPYLSEQSEVVGRFSGDAVCLFAVSAVLLNKLYRRTFLIFIVTNFSSGILS